VEERDQDRITSLSLFGRARAAYRAWSTDKRFAWAARYQFVVAFPVAAIAAILLMVVRAWLPAVVFALAAAYMGNWLWSYRTRGE
jgi:hypothetical protein